MKLTKFSLKKWPNFKDFYQIFKEIWPVSALQLGNCPKSHCKSGKFSPKNAKIYQGNCKNF
jgi:hypothetical protein